MWRFLPVLVPGPLHTIDNKTSWAGLELSAPSLQETALDNIYG
jgi:hypothetical protein